MNQAQLAGYRPPTSLPWSPARGRSRALAQEGAPMVERSFMNTDDPEIRNFLVSNGVALGYGVLGGFLYGRGQLLNRVLLGLGAAAFGYASYSGFRVGLKSSPTKTTADYVAGNALGLVDGLIALGAAFGAISPRAAQRRSGSDVVIASMPV